MEKKYSINTDNGEIISVEVNGTQYEHPDQIPDPDDRAQILRLLANASDDNYDPSFEHEFDPEFDPDFGPEFEAHFHELDRQSEQLPKIICGIFLVVAIPLLATAGISGWLTLKAIAKEESAPGRVIDLVQRESWNNEQRRSETYAYPVVEFTITNQSRRSVQLSEGSWPPAYDKGDQVTILYDPDQPNHARINSLSSTIVLWILPTVTGFLGVVFLVLALVIGHFLKPVSAK
ncbi:MAG TPA: DUF3592 domain-containing protein [Stenomitos sp.]